MKISTYIKLFVVLVGATVLAVGFISLLAIDRSNYFREKANLASAQLTELVELARNTSHLSEHVVEHFAFRKLDIAEIEHAKADIAVSLEKLNAATEAEAQTLRSRDEVKDEQDDLVRFEKIRAIYSQTNLLIEDILTLSNQGNVEQARAKLEKEFSNKAMIEFESIIAEWIEDERGEVAAAEASADAFWDWLRTMAFLMTAFIFGLMLWLSYFLLGKFGKPIASLTASAAAFAEGRLDHRITINSKDEFGVLASSFNTMAAMLEREQLSQDEIQQELEHKFQQRTEDLHEKASELDKANTRLALVDKNRAQFLADISHELRTPLTTLRGEAELALRLPLKTAKPYRDVLGRILRLSENIGRLVDDLLFLARSDSDTVRFDMRSVDLIAIAQVALEDAIVLAQSKNVNVRAMFDRKTPIKIEGDPSRIQQALLIALDNAIKFSPAGKNVDFLISENEDAVEVAVRDFGNGVAQEDLPYVFERFYRAKNAKNQPGGFGLGLSIAKWIVDKHGGRISIASIPNSYTELKLTFPPFAAASGGVKN